MDALRATIVLWALAIALAGARAVGAPPPPPPRGCDPPILLPDPAADGVQRLAWLPSLGPGRAARLVRARPALGAPLTPATWTLLPGFGESSAREVRAALARWSLRAAAQG